MIRKLDKGTVHSSFIDNSCGAYLADMQLISKFSRGFRILLGVIDIYRKYAGIIPLKDKKDITISNAFHKILKESIRKPNKIGVDKGIEFYNRSMKLWLEQNNIEMYSTHNEGKSVAAEKFIRTFKNKICKYMISVSKYVYIDKLVDIVNKYNNTYDSTIKVKLIDVKPNIYNDSSKEINEKDPKFKFGHTFRISKQENVFTKGYTPNWSEEVFVIKNVANTVPWTYVISDIKRE